MSLVCVFGKLTVNRVTVIDGDCVLVLHCFQHAPTYFDVFSLHLLACRVCDEEYGHVRPSS